MAGELTKGYIGKEDLQIQTNTNAAETFERTSSVGGTQTITKFPDIWDGTGRVNAGQIDLNSVNPWMGFIRGFEISRKDTDEIYLSGGMIHINDGTTEGLYRSTSQISHVLTNRTASVINYVYLTRPTSGSTIATGNISISSTAPTYNHARGGWYYGATRFVGSVVLNVSSNITAFSRSENGHLVMYDIGKNSQTITSGSWTDITDITLWVPSIDGAQAVMLFKLDEPTVGGQQTRILYVRRNGATSAGIEVCKTGSQCPFYGVDTLGFGNYSFSSFVDSNMGRFPVDANGKLEWKTATLVTGSSWVLGYWEPR